MGETECFENLDRESEVAMPKSGPPLLKNFSPTKQRRLDELLEKNAEGTITPREKSRLEQLVEEAERLMVDNARRLARFSKSEAGRVPTGAVPLTVWVHPNGGDR